MRSAAPIEGQLSFGVLLEEPAPPESSESSESSETPRRGEPATKDVAIATVPPPEAPSAPPALTDDVTEDIPHTELRADPQDWHAILDFERGWTGSPSAKQRAVRDRFGIGSARYHQLLDRALERPEALVYDPALVGRLRRVRETRRRKRFAERLEVDPPGDRHGDRPTGQGGGSG